MKKILFTAIIWLAALNCMGQELNKKNMVSLNFGMGYNARQDLIFSPLVHTDFSLLNVGIDYSREAKLFQKVILRYGSFNPMASTPYDFTIHGEPNTAYPHSFNIIDIDYLLGKKIKEYKRSSLTTGGILVIDIQALNYVYGRVSSFGYYSMVGMGVFGRHQYMMNKKNRLSTTLQLPLVAWLARSPYLVNDDEFIENTSSHSGINTFLAFQGDGQFVTMNKLQTFDFDVNYSHDLGEKWGFSIDYLFEFIHTDNPRNLLSFLHALKLSANYIF